jgi:hypothetical protein
MTRATAAISVAQGLDRALAKGSTTVPTDGCATQACSTTACRPRSTCRIDCVIVETPVPNVPYGVRGVGEVDRAGA